jgi:sugar lactone lactonase YvrE
LHVRRALALTAILLTSIAAEGAGKRRATSTPFQFVASPRTVPIRGGTSVIVHGRGYVAGQTFMRIDGAAVAATVLSPTQLRFTAPAHANGYVPAEITTPSEKAYAELLYVPPSLAEINSGFITTVAGVGRYLAEGRLARAAPVEPQDIAIAPDETLYLAEPNLGVVRRVRADGVLERVAGIGADYAGENIGDGGPARDATLVFPVSVEFGPDGALYIADTFNNRIRRVGADGVIRTVAGSGPNGSCCLGEFGGDGGAAIAAKLNQPNQVRFDGAGNMYILDALNARIRRVDTGGVIATVAGNGQRGFSGDGGPATAARFDTGPNGDTGAMRVAPDGTIYLLDVNNARLRRIDAASGIITTIAGGGTRTDDGALATEGQIFARGFALAPDGSILLAEFTRIRRITPDGRMQTVFGSATSASPKTARPAAGSRRSTA